MVVYCADRVSSVVSGPTPVFPSGAVRCMRRLCVQLNGTPRSVSLVPRSYARRRPREYPVGVTDVARRASQYAVTSVAGRESRAVTRDGARVGTSGVAHPRGRDVSSRRRPRPLRHSLPLRHPQSATAMLAAPL